MANKVAIVTGASAGIGTATVLELLAGGYIVHAAARRVEAMKELEKAGAQIHRVDLTIAENIDAFVAEVIERSGRIDVLVNNAGYGAYGAIEEVPMSEARAQMEVNLFALARLIQLVVPTMRGQRSGRIINVGSIGGKIWSPLGGWYHASKFAVEGLSDCLRNELRPFGVDVIVIEPGGIKTEWGGIAVENMRKNSGSGPYRAIVEAVAPLFSMEIGMGTAGQIAKVIHRAASARRPKTRYVSPISGKIILWLRWVLSDRMFDWFFSKVGRLPKRLPDPTS